MEEAEEDDMTCGDLGNGLGRRPGGVYEGENLQNSYSIRSRKGSVKACNAPSSAKVGEESDGAALPGPKRNSVYDGSLKKPAPSSTRQNSCGKSNMKVNYSPWYKFLLVKVSRSAASQSIIKFNSNHLPKSLKGSSACWDPSPSSQNIRGRIASQWLRQ